MKVEAPNVDVGLGFRLDTGLNVGVQGARVCFAGIGGEAVLKEESAEGIDDKGWLQRVGERFHGFGFQFWLIKVKAVW